MSQLSNLKKVSDKDRRMIRDAEAMMGPEPQEMGFVKNLFWGRFRNDLIFPYPDPDAYENAKCEALLQKLNHYLTHEHPAIEIDQNQEIPQWVFDRLFEIGVMGMTIPETYGGLGLGVTSYNRVLSAIGARCAATSVVVSAHQSIGCKALMLFGTEAQKQRYLPMVAKEKLSAFCLSEPNVGCDAGGQETTCYWDEARKGYVLNGEKKWSTSGAFAGLYTVMAKQKLANGEEAVTALIVTPDMKGIDVFQKNRSKCGIRGTWQARIRFHNVFVPQENLLHKEGRGLQVALTCLNYGRCTLSAGVFGAAEKAADQAIKWARTRYQFQRPLADFDLVQQHIAQMSAFNFAMSSMLYITTGMLDRKDKDIMVETAITKVFCSEMGNRVLNSAMQIMGGEGYATENELERAWRDGRIYTIVEGANEVMQSFIFAYGGKQLAESLLAIKDRVIWDGDESLGKNLTRILPNLFKPKVLAKALPLGLEVILGIRKAAPEIKVRHATLKPYAARLANFIADHTYQFKKTSMVAQEAIVTQQVMQARLADNAMYFYALSACLSKMDALYAQEVSGTRFEADKAAFIYFFEWAALQIAANIRGLKENADVSMRLAAQAAITHNDQLPNHNFYIPEKSPSAAGSGKTIPTKGIMQFGAISTPQNTSSTPGFAAPPTYTTSRSDLNTELASEPVQAEEVLAMSSQIEKDGALPHFVWQDITPNENAPEPLKTVSWNTAVLPRHRPEDANEAQEMPAEPSPAPSPLETPPSVLQEVVLESAPEPANDLPEWN